MFGRVSFLLILLSTLFLSSSLAFSQEDETSTKAKRVPRSERSGSSIYFGHILDVDRNVRSIFVRPVDGKGPRRTFYLDRKTYVTLVEFGIRYKRRRSDLVGGEKVAIRYLWMGKTFFAEEVFVVTGKFYRGAYTKKNYRGEPRKRYRKKIEETKEVDVVDDEETEAEDTGDAVTEATETPQTS